MVRHAALLINPDLLVGMFTHNNEICVRVTTGLPAGTRVVAVDYQYPHLRLVVEHDTFPEIQRGDPLPVLDVFLSDQRQQ